MIVNVATTKFSVQAFAAMGLDHVKWKVSYQGDPIDDWGKSMGNMEVILE